MLACMANKSACIATRMSVLGGSRSKMGNVGFNVIAEKFVRAYCLVTLIRCKTNLVFVVVGWLFAGWFALEHAQHTEQQRAYEKYPPQPGVLAHTVSLNPA